MLCATETIPLAGLAQFGENLACHVAHQCVKRDLPCPNVSKETCRTYVACHVAHPCVKRDLTSPNVSKET
jgi:hypothetical protein